MSEPVARCAIDHTALLATGHAALLATDHAALLARVQRGLRMVTAAFPHLAGLCAAARVVPDERVPTMGVFASGRMVVNPAFAAKLKDADLVFVLAHEMLHLALRTHDRAKGADRLAFNYAHDYIINDVLRVALGVTHIPAGGLDMPGAKDKSAERIMIEMRRDASMPSRTRVWDGEAAPARRALGEAGGSSTADDAGDVLEDALERELYPHEADAQADAAERMRALADKAHALARAMAALRGTEAGGLAAQVSALRGVYRTPWEQALQRWMESVAPAERTFTRASRRGGQRSDVVLPGRRREGWMLNVILDTSGSMTDELPRALGAIADFSDAAGVDRVRLVQCDAALAADEVVAPEALARCTVAGFGGSDLAPAFEYLADDPHVAAALVITDGDVALPAERPPFSVLWIVPAAAAGRFVPSFGRVLVMEPR